MPSGVRILPPASRLLARVERAIFAALDRAEKFNAHLFIFIEHYVYKLLTHYLLCMNNFSRFFSSFNLQILELLVDESASVRDLAKKAKCSPAKVTQFLNLYTKNRLVVARKEKNRKIISLNKTNPLVKEFIRLIYINKILDSKTFSSLKKTSSSIGLYGSAVEGTLDKKSDIDLWVVSDKRKKIVETGKLKQQFTKELGREVSLKFFTPEDICRLKEKDKIFFNELEYKSKILHGDGF